MEQKHLLPDFFILGPPKTGSSSLHFYLDQHPQIFMSTKKDPRFFDKDYEKGLAFYTKYFQNAPKSAIKGEASAAYAFLPFVAERIKQDLPNSKLILCFRNPVERAYSGWLMRKESGTEKIGFIEALNENIKQRGNLDFFNDDLLSTWLTDQRKIENINQLSLRTYIEGGLYSHQLETYRKHFPSTQIHVIFLEDLRDNLAETMQSLFEFLGVDPDFKLKSTEVRNPFQKNKLKGLTNVFGKKRLSQMAGLFPKNIKNKIISMAKVAQEKPRLTQEERLFASKVFEEDIRRLETILQKDLSHWKMKSV